MHIPLLSFPTLSLLIAVTAGTPLHPRVLSNLPAYPECAPAFEPFPLKSLLSCFLSSYPSITTIQPRTPRALAACNLSTRHCITVDTHLLPDMQALTLLDLVEGLSRIDKSCAKKGDRNDEPRVDWGRVDVARFGNEKGKIQGGKGEDGKVLVTIHTMNLHQTPESIAEMWDGPEMKVCGRSRKVNGRTVEIPREESMIPTIDRKGSWAKKLKRWVGLEIADDSEMMQEEDEFPTLIVREDPAEKTGLVGAIPIIVTSGNGNPTGKPPVANNSFTGPSITSTTSSLLEITLAPITTTDVSASATEEPTVTTTTTTTQEPTSTPPPTPVAICEGGRTAPLHLEMSTLVLCWIQHYGYSTSTLSGSNKRVACIDDFCLAIYLSERATSQNMEIEIQDPLGKILPAMERLGQHCQQHGVAQGIADIELHDDRYQGRDLVRLHSTSLDKNWGDPDFKQNKACQGNIFNLKPPKDEGKKQ